MSEETVNLVEDNPDRIGLEAPAEQSEADQAEVSGDEDEDEEESGDDSEAMDE